MHEKVKGHLLKGKKKGNFINTISLLNPSLFVCDRWLCLVNYLLASLRTQTGFSCMSGSIYPPLLFPPTLLSSLLTPTQSSSRVAPKTAERNKQTCETSPCKGSSLCAIKTLSNGWLLSRCLCSLVIAQLASSSPPALSLSLSLSPSFPHSLSCPLSPSVNVAKCMPPCWKGNARSAQQPPCLAGCPGQLRAADTAARACGNRSSTELPLPPKGLMSNGGEGPRDAPGHAARPNRIKH